MHNLGLYSNLRFLVRKPKCVYQKFNVFYVTLQSLINHLQKLLVGRFVWYFPKFAFLLMEGLRGKKLSDVWDTSGGTTGPWDSQVLKDHKIKAHKKKLFSELGKISLLCSFSIFQAQSQPTWESPPFLHPWPNPTIQTPNCTAVQWRLDLLLWTSTVRKLDVCSAFISFDNINFISLV